MADRLVTGQPGTAAQAGRRSDAGDVGRGSAGQVRASLGGQCLPVPPTLSTAFGRTGSPCRSPTWSWTARRLVISSPNWAIVIDCSPSDSASSGSGMDLDHDPVGAGRDAGQGTSA